MGRSIPRALYFFALLLSSAAAAQTAAPEYGVKAAFLYKFGDFVAWPANTYADAATPVTLCIAGEDPFGHILDEVVAGSRIDRRAIELRRLHDPWSDAASCQILYAKGAKSAEILSAVAAKPVLTITDAAPAGAAGIINFVLKDNRVRFEIDARAATAAGLEISSKLLALATNVRRSEP